jgi:hypothetical protein
MPINLFNNPLSSIKLGVNDILKGYIGNNQIFPNNTEITAAAFTNSNIANTGGNTPYVVSGDIGSSFTLTGSNGATAPSGTQVISVSPATYQIAIADQSNVCGSLQRTPQVIITPQGNTVLASGLNNTDTIIQAAGPVNQANNNSLSISAVNTVYNTVTVGGQLRWSTGAKWTVTISYTAGIQNAVEHIRARFTNPASPNLFPVYSPQNPISPGLGTWLYGGGGNDSSIKTGFVFASGGTDIVNPPSGTYSFDVVIGSNVGSFPYVNFYTDLTPATGCYTTAVPSASTGLIYP